LPFVCFIVFGGKNESEFTDIDLIDGAESCFLTKIDLYPLPNEKSAGGAGTYRNLFPAGATKL